MQYLPTSFIANLFYNITEVHLGLSRNLLTLAFMDAKNSTAWGRGDLALILSCFMGKLSKIS